MKFPNIIIRKSCPYGRDQLIEASNKGFTDRFKIKTRGTRATVGPLSLCVGFGKSAEEKLNERDLSWLKE
jgi:hypothetical protein